jgi:hypothetical protein
MRIAVEERIRAASQALAALRWRHREQEIAADEYADSSKTGIN